MRPTSRRLVLLALVSCLGLGPAPAAADDATEPTLSTETISGLALRSIGPALMGGRIADIAVSPIDSSTWYVAVGSGGVWKTTNAGTTWTPIFDDQPVYSTGCVTVDPNRPDVIWVGSGENVSGRHVGWGDGVYKSLDGGATWRNMGLDASEHIGKVVVDPRDSDVVFVAAEGPLWSSGGERGLYKTTDGGETWSLVLDIDADTGVTDVEIDPRDPDVMYAASYQRRRHVWSLLAGGPGSGLHKSTDGGETWRRLETGLPTTDMGKIGLDVSGADPDVVYATIEANEDDRGFYRSLDRGESWEKRSSYISNGTGPHYYQEIEASPHDVDVVYQMDVFLHRTRDGGASFQIVGDGRQKHSDNHALVIDPADPEHLIVGTDASIYESFDEGATWRQFGNLPIGQFYRVAIDTSEPFTWVLGGAQDLGTLLGPTRTASLEGIRNQDWSVPLGADGHQAAFDPENPDIAYMEWQVGNLQRYDRQSHELLDIRPVPAPGDPPERFNWDSPLLVSPHAANRLYFGTQRVWQSDDRGESWTAISDDLTTDRNRYTLEMMGRVWSVDDLYDNGAMSWYATTTVISESPRVEGLLYVGTDDGKIQVREGSEAAWREANTLPGLPMLSYINDLQASHHDDHTVFAAADSHKTGVFRPFLAKSKDRGATWASIAGDLPESTIVWSIEQDHVDPDLLFAGTEHGAYFTPDGGTHWVKLPGTPTISFRDLEIQTRDDDLVGATFGRGFYVLDDYAPLRSIAAGALDDDTALYPVRDAWWYVPNAPMQAAGKPSLGSADYDAPNPPFGAIITWSMREAPTTAKERRNTTEEELREAGRGAPFPGWDELRSERLEPSPKLLFTVRDAAGEPVRRIEVEPAAGVHRTAWDLRLPPPDPIDLSEPGFRPPWASDPKGPLAPPGSYTVEAELVTANGVTRFGEPQSFDVVPVPTRVFGDPDEAAVAEFRALTNESLRVAEAASSEIGRAQVRLRHLRPAIADAPRADARLLADADAVAASLDDLARRLRGDRDRGALNEPSTPSVLGRLWTVAGGHWDTRQAPTNTQRDSQAIAIQELETINEELEAVLGTTLPELEAAAEAAGARWTPGRALPTP